MASSICFFAFACFSASPCSSSIGCAYSISVPFRASAAQQFSQRGPSPLSRLGPLLPALEGSGFSCHFASRRLLLAPCLFWPVGSAFSALLRSTGNFSQIQKPRVWRLSRLPGTFRSPPAVAAACRSLAPPLSRQTLLTLRSRPLPPVAGRCAIKRRAAPLTYNVRTITKMRSGYKLALLVILTAPVLFLALKYTLLGAYRGLIERNIPMGEEPATGWAAVAIGLYSLLMASGVVFTIGYLSVWMLG